MFAIRTYNQGEFTSRLSIGGGIFTPDTAGGDKGPGTINARAVYDDNALLSCYVFDQALDGRIDEAKWNGKSPDWVVRYRGGVDVGEQLASAESEANGMFQCTTRPRPHTPMRRFRARIGTAHAPLTLDGDARHWQEKRHLTAMPNEAGFDPVADKLATGEWIQRLVETVEIHAVLIEGLNRKLKASDAGGAAAPSPSRPKR